jgi:hypothetical protein
MEELCPRVRLQAASDHGEVQSRLLGPFPPSCVPLESYVKRLRSLQSTSTWRS